MKAVPSLVASTTVGIAATGLALGKAESSRPVRSPSTQRKATDLVDVGNHDLCVSPPASRPGTGSTMITPNNKSIPHKTGSSSGSYPPQAFYNRPSNARLDSLFHSGGRRSSIVPSDEALPPVESAFEGARRDSVSSRGSWIKRLSAMPTPSANSPRSSIGPELASQTLSHTSGTPILSNPADTLPPLKPNKLVKRVPSGRASSGEYTRSRSKSQVPTLRRPATSHQRSATLHQRFREDAMRKDQLQRSTSLQAMHDRPDDQLSSPTTQTIWRPFFDARPRKVSRERSSGRPSLGNNPNSYTYARRVLPQEDVKATLLTPDMITVGQRSDGEHDAENCLLVHDAVRAPDEMDADLTDTEGSAKKAQRRARRSFSMNFSSPTSWVSRGGSLRGKRPVEAKDAQKRYSSAPISSLPSRHVATSHGATKNSHRNITDPTVFQRETQPEVAESLNDPFIAAGFGSSHCNGSSPLPSLSQTYSSNHNVSQTGRISLPPQISSPSLPQDALRSTQVDNAASPLLPAANLGMALNPVKARSPRTSEITDRASTLVDSDTDQKACLSGEDDDLDFQSETVFDSLRSGATGSMRSRKTTLDVMFDESPPSLSGHTKSKRAPVYELVSNDVFQDGNKIVEEDEGMSTPVRSTRASEEDNLHTPVRKIIHFDADLVRPSPPSFSLATNHSGLLSLDADDEDEDWTKDDEYDVNNQLSPPSSSLSSRRDSLALRAALADVTHTNGHTNGERPKSNLFDWSEPSVEKPGSSGQTSRPKTACPQQNGDVRGGRANGRKGPTAMHIRSQSVPVVPDVAGQRETANLAPKFGTWGLGGKGVSEDWDNDFEFDVHDETGDVESPEADLLMRVPPAIQASQATVVGHVGQIREVCLLVEDLKRLRNLAREKDLLGGSTATLWKEAEGIIALAVPDEEDLTLSPPRSPSSSFFDHDDDHDDYEHDRYVSHGFDVGEVGITSNGHSTRRQTVFSPDDDIFGIASEIDNPPIRDNLRLPQGSQGTPRHSSAKSSDVARSVMETMHQHRSTSDPLLLELTDRSLNKMPFDTTSLRDLVHRASVLSRTLADIVRKSEGLTTSPDCSPRRDTSPAFTRVFTDPMSKTGPAKQLPRSHSNNSVLSSPMDVSPPRSLGQRMHMMAVN